MRHAASRAVLAFPVRCRHRHPGLCRRLRGGTGETAGHAVGGAVGVAAAGDTVLIHWRTEPYRDKWVIARAGTAVAPIVVRGVPGPGGELPVIDGSGAVTRLALDTWGESRCVIKIGGASIPADVMPAYITVEGLDIRGAPHARTRSWTTAAPRRATSPTPRRSTSRRASTSPSAATACTTAATASSSARPSPTCRATSWSRATPSTTTATSAASTSTTPTPRRSASSTSSTASAPLRAGAGGNNLKDRSAGLVVRYNWIEGGNRQLDLVETDSATIQASPALPPDVRLRQRADRDRRRRQQPDRPLRRRQRHHLELPQGHAVLLPQHAGVVSHRQHDAVPAVDQRRTRRRAQQHLLRDGRRDRRCRCSTRLASCR